MLKHLELHHLPREITFFNFIGYRIFSGFSHTFFHVSALEHTKKHINEMSTTEMNSKFEAFDKYDFDHDEQFQVRDNRP